MARIEPAQTRILRHLLLETVGADHQEQRFRCGLCRDQDCGCPRYCASPLLSLTLVALRLTCDLGREILSASAETSGRARERRLHERPGVADISTGGPGFRGLLGERNANRVISFGTAERTAWWCDSHCGSQGHAAAAMASRYRNDSHGVHDCDPAAGSHAGMGIQPLHLVRYGTRAVVKPFQLESQRRPYRWGYAGVSFGRCQPH